MRGLLGSHGKVKPWYLPFDWVLCRISINYRTRVVVVRNKIAPNVYGLPVEVESGRVTRVLSDVEPIPLLPPIVPAADGVNGPQKVIVPTSDGEFIASKNFSDVSPEFRQFKRLGWALRYVNGIRRQKRSKGEQ